MIKKYYELTKAGLVFGNLITVIAGFLLASKGEHLSFAKLIATLVGMSLVMASGCVFNNYVDRDIDALMTRTKDRVLVKKGISHQNALLFGGILGVLGFLVLLIFTNVLTAFLSVFGFFFYVFMYTLWFKRSTVYGVGVGAVAGAIPPVVGYCAVTNRFDTGALILFLILLTWQMPHFFAIAIRRQRDYEAASIPVMPIENGMTRTKISMFIYIIEFMIAATLLSVFGYTGYSYLIIVVISSLLWLALCIKGFYISGVKGNELWARQMFLTSLVVMMITFITISIGALI